MIFTDILLTSLAYASIIIATLRASSRLLYLLEHGSIGAMEGPLILGPNEMKDIASATPVWDLSYAFQQGVQLSLFPEFFEYRDHNGEIEYKGKEKSNYNLERTTNIVYNSTYGDYATAQVTAYAPGVFDDLRSRFGVTKESFQNSILNGSFISFQSNSKGAARVGGVFFFTRDGAYMIKTIKKEEVKTFQEMLPNYHEHMKKNGRKSLLTRFSGMFTVTIKHKKTERTETFVIMNSVFPPESSQFIAERYDLKGSTVGRECSEREKARKGSNAILKDLDLAREVELIRSYGQSRKRSTVAHGFKIGWRKKTALLSQLQKDVKFLIKSNVMDYSLLVGVVNMDSRKLDLSLLETLERSKALESKRRNRKGFKRAFYLSIIPIRILAFPFFSVGRRTTALGNNMLSTFLDVPLPYYGAGVCGVDGGAFSIIEGKKAGKRCLFYLGLIDFLQPWTSRKKLERKAKAVMGHNVHAISCVDPEEYGTRFLNFMEAHLS
mmetsp:Transcript_30463/g.46129  ORF Transcript_30463/g.46129 Transcript_30463/m.46129 type:complete len:494 (-) Transcript_30463:197-1678(-)|eukprot:CAMPEP_0178927632 /NCGR_PEP_ID=MMETSP0786-20121207/19320_1 /TAXON_ID=186022 /ORGANISM="Thalassionema frauenfeldii, Strain CCMP 1798" /LENGTH=493 /DNA_ID=CAMNT_0020603135 /DNA_START=121 /DNA_END=1602 /DNA_ORIENTATION=+